MPVRCAAARPFRASAEASDLQRRASQAPGADLPAHAARARQGSQPQPKLTPRARAPDPCRVQMWRPRLRARVRVAKANEPALEREAP